MRSYKLSITLRAPIMTRSTAIGAYGVDSPVARDADGFPYIPGSHVQGKLREALGDLASVADDPEEAGAKIAKWFGAEGMDGGEHRKRVIVTDLAFDRDRDVNPPDLQAAARKPDAPSRTRTAIDDASGAALDHAVQDAGDTVCRGRRGHVFRPRPHPSQRSDGRRHSGVAGAGALLDIPDWRRTKRRLRPDRRGAARA